MGLNIYYVGMSFWGLYQWRRADRNLENIDSCNSVHLNRINCRVLLASALIFVLGTISLIFLLRWMGDAESAADASVAVLSAIATYWLAKSYIQQWLLWTVADIMSGVLCLMTGMYWMAVLYIFYAASAVYGYYYWNKNGVYIK